VTQSSSGRGNGGDAVFLRVGDVEEGLRE